MKIARIEIDAGGVRHLGPARHRRHGRFHVLQLHGGPYDTAFQHGALLREEIPRGPLPLFERYVALLLRKSPLGPLAGPAHELLDRWTQRRLVARLPLRMRAMAAGLADGAGLDERAVLRAFLLPDALIYTTALLGRLGRAPLACGCPAPPLGCTSAVAAPGRTRRGMLLHGRNLDFVGAGRWDLEPTVSFYHPEDGQPFVELGAAGIAGGGITGMNAAGLTFAVHQHFPVEVNLDGEPLGLAGEQVLREAKTLDEAIGILDRHHPVSAWTYVLADATRAVAYEVTPRMRRLVEMQDGYLGCTNVYMHPDLQNAERNIYPAYDQANHSRHKTVWRRLRADASHTEDSIASILNDHRVDGLAADGVFGDTVCTPYTVLSVVFRPADRRFFVGEGPVPNCAGRYLGFDLRGEGPGGKPAFIDAGEARESPRVAAVNACGVAWKAFVEDADLPAARAALDGALAAYDGDPMVHHLAGLLALKAVDVAAAEVHLHGALARETRPPRLARTRVALAFALALAGRREESAACVAEARRLAPDDAVVRRQLKGRFSPGRARALPVDLLYGDVLV